MYGLRREAMKLRSEEGAGQAQAVPPRLPLAESAGEFTVELSVLERHVDHSTEIAEEPFRYLLRLCASRGVEDLLPYARSDFRYRDLYEWVNEFRGQVLRFRGRVRRVREVPVPARPDYGVEKYYECWVFTKDGGRLPYCVISARPPRGIPVAERMNIPCEVVGVFLGWWKHETAGRHLLSSPIVIAPELRRAELPRVSGEGGAIWVGAVVAALILFGLVFVLWLAGRPSRPLGTGESVDALDLRLADEEAAHEPTQTGQEE